MYAYAVTQRAIAEANLWQLQSADPSDRWALQPHTASEINSAISHFNHLRDEETGVLHRALNAEEQQFISNERRLCALDFSYYGKYAKLIAWDGSVQSFKPNVAQAIVLDLWGQLESAALAISMQQLKARQLGVSLMTELAVAHRVQFHPRTNGVIASSSPEKSRKLAKMIEFAWTNMPWWLMPEATKFSQGMPAEFGQLHSGLSIQAGNAFTGLARGETPNVLHASELCEWDDAKKKIDADLKMHETPDIFLVLESTALGRGNWWHDTWKLSKRDWDRGRSRFCPVFLPWFVGIDIYPTKTWLRARPVPDQWQPKDITIKHAERARDYVLSNKLLFKHLAKNDQSWQMPKSQMWFYEVERDQAVAKSILNQFLAEMPADDQEAFQSTKTSAINGEIIVEYRERIRAPKGVYGLIGSGIPDSLIPSRRLWDSSKPVINIIPAQILPRATERFQLVPLIFNGYSDIDPENKVFIYEDPEPNEIYGGGVDTSDGVGLDRAALEFVRKGSPTRRDSQVAEFVSSMIKSRQLWPFALALGTYFSTLSTTAGRRVPCRIAVETMSGGGGETVQYELKKRGWTNFHPWLQYNAKKFANPGKAVREGFRTNMTTRGQLVDIFLTFVDEQTLLINSPYLVDEMSAFERDETRQRLQASAGEHDDRILALGFILFSLYVNEIPNRQFSQRGRFLPPMDVEIDDRDQQPLPTWQPGAQERGLAQLGKISIERRMPVHGRPGFAAKTSLGKFVSAHMPKRLR